MRKAPSASMIIGVVFCVVGTVFTCVGAGLAAIDLLFLYIFGGIGLLFLLIGIPFLVVVLRKRKMIRMLLERGVQTQAVITAVTIDHGVRVNGRHPYRAECKVTDSVTGEVYLYSSPRVMEDIHYLVGSTVTVYYDRNNRSRYYVDIESAMEAALSDGGKIHDFR